MTYAAGQKCRSICSTLPIRFALRLIRTNAWSQPPTSPPVATVAECWLMVYSGGDNTLTTHGAIVLTARSAFTCYRTSSGETMEMLRDAYEVCPGFHDQLYNQIDYLVSQRTILPDAPTSQISPTSFMPVLFWENRYGITQGMEQTEMATFLSQAANLYAKHGAKEARETMRYAFQAFESLFLTAGEHTGGVLSEVQDECGAKIARFRKCFWFPFSRRWRRHRGSITSNEGGQDRYGAKPEFARHRECALHV